jgi:hypothetical protein
LTVIGSPSKRPPLFARQRGISVVGYRARSVEIPHDDGVDLLIKRLDRFGAAARRRSASDTGGASAWRSRRRGTDGPQRC